MFLKSVPEGSQDLSAASLYSMEITRGTFVKVAVSQKVRACSKPWRSIRGEGTLVH